jgi:predicted permease
MSTPQPILGKALAPVTQERKPWRATLRTIFQAAVGFASMWALIVETIGLDPSWQWVSASLAVTGAVTRVMAVPAVNEFLARFLPFLAPDEPRRILGKA